MPPLKAKLSQRLKGATRIAVLGVGSDLRGDDAAGLLAVSEFKRQRAAFSRSHGQRARRSHPIVKCFIGGTAPENSLGAIRRFQPSHLIVIASLIPPTCAKSRAHWPVWAPAN